MAYGKALVLVAGLVMGGWSVATNVVGLVHYSGYPGHGANAGKVYATWQAR